METIQRKRLNAYLGVTMIEKHLDGYTDDMIITKLHEFRQQIQDEFGLKNAHVFIEEPNARVVSKNLVNDVKGPNVCVVIDEDDFKNVDEDLTIAETVHAMEILKTDFNLNRGTNFQIKKAIEMAKEPII